MAHNKLRSGIVVSYLAAGISTVVSMLYTPFMLRMLGQSEYGIYQLVYSIAGYLTLLSFGFGSAYIRFFSNCTGADKEKKIASLNGMFMTIFCVLSAVCCVVGFAIIPNIRSLFQNLTPDEIRTAKVLLSFLVVNVALTFPNSVLDSYITAHEEFVFQKLVYLLKTVLNPLLTIPFLLLGFKSITLVVITTVLTAVSMVINFLFCTRKLGMRFCFKRVEFSLFRSVAVFSLFIFLNIVTDQINWNVSKFLLGIFRGSTDIAVYGVAAQLNTYYMDCAILVSAVFIPKVNKIAVSHTEENRFDGIFMKVGRIQFMILALVCTGFIFFGKQFIALWAGQGYEQSYYLAVILLLAVTVPMIQNTGIEIQKAQNMHKFRSLLYVGIAVGNLLLSVALTPILGVFGCVIGTAAGLFVGNTLIMNIYYKRKIKIDIGAFWRSICRILPSFILPVVVGILYTLFVEKTLVTFVLGIGVYTTVYMVSLYFIGMNEDERNLIKRPIRKILAGIKR